MSKTEITIGKLIESQTTQVKRLMVGIPVTGQVRIEWAQARYGQTIPCNWSFMEFCSYMDQYSPLKYTVADARNIIASKCVETGHEWLLFIDHDVVLPVLFMVKANDYMIRGETPIFGGLYFTKSVPSEPLIYRGRGNGYFHNWKFGDKVWVDGMGLGCHLIHGSILKVLYDTSPSYQIGNTVVREIFKTPQRIFYDPESRLVFAQSGTEDMEFYTRIMNEGVLKKAGWPKISRKKYPFLCDTSLFCRHISMEGIRYPAKGEELEYARKEKPPARS